MYVCAAVEICKYKLFQFVVDEEEKRRFSSVVVLEQMLKQVFCCAFLKVRDFVFGHAWQHLHV